MKFGDFRHTILEGVYDPGIFKAFFLAGGAGSGKSYSAEKATGSRPGKFEWHDDMKKLKPGKTGPFGLKVVNSDEQLEFGLMKAKLHSNMSIYTPDELASKELIRKTAKEKTLKKEAGWVQGRLGLIIDGTAKDPNKIARKKHQLEQIGYDCYMIFVDTSLDVALQQNSERSRKLDDQIVRLTHDEVQKSKKRLNNIFGKGFIEIVNNRAGESIFNKAFNSVNRLISRAPNDARARAWMANELEKKKKGDRGKT